MSTGNELVTLKQVDNYYKDLRKRSAPVIFNNAVGNPVVFSDGADGLPIQSLKVQMLPRQEGTGDPSPQNIRPIVAWDGVNLFHTGKNLFDTNTVYSDTSKFTINGNAVTGTAGNFANTKLYIPSEFVGKKLTFSARITTGAYTTYLRTRANIGGTITNGNMIASGTTGVSAVTFIPSADTDYIYFGFGTGVKGENVVAEIQLEVGQTATAYEPYVPITETDIPFTSPVYGGTLDVVSGVLTVEWAKITLDGRSTSGIFLYDSGNGFGLNPKNIYLPMKSGANLDGVCNIMPTVKVSTGYGCRFGMNSEYIYLVQCMDVFGSTVAEFLQYLTTHNLELCYPLATPQEIQLTPQQITALVGDNTIWSDANGDIEVEYRADTNKFIEEAIVNQPHAGNNGIYGIMAPGPGLSVLNDRVVTAHAGTQSIKQGTSTNLIISPAFISDATFYGLSRAAGVDMANSSNPVGQFTDEAKVAIQKMLGVYEPPFELLNNITLAERTCIDLTADDYGLPYNLLEVFVYIHYPPDLETEATGYGRFRFYDSTNNEWVNAETSRYISSTNQQFKLIHVIKRGNLTIANFTRITTTENPGQWQTKSFSSQGYSLDLGNITRIAMASNDYEPAGANIKIYGRKAY